MLLQLALIASLLLGADAPEVLTTFAEGPDSHPEEARETAAVEGPLRELPLPLPAEVPAPPPPPSMANLDWVIIGSVIGTLGSGLLVALGAMCAAGECENADGDGMAPMIVITTVGAGLVVTSAVVIPLGAQRPDPEARDDVAHASLRLSLTGAELRLQF